MVAEVNIWFKTNIGQAEFEYFCLRQLQPQDIIYNHILYTMSLLHAMVHLILLCPTSYQ